MRNHGLFAKSSKAGYAVLLALLLYGCNPYQFVMGGPHLVTCQILTSLNGVDHNDYMATLHDTAALDLNYYGATQYYITMGMRLEQGQGFRILLRTDVEHTDVKDSGIIVTATTAGVSLEDSGRVLLSRREAAISAGQIIHVALISENNYYQVVFDCDTIVRGWTKRNESDNVVVQALEASTVDVIHPDWAGLPDISEDSARTELQLVKKRKTP